MKTAKVLFMGASRLVGLLERFLKAAFDEEISIEMFSLEDSAPWHAIAVSGVSHVIEAPKFGSSEFESFLVGLVDAENISILIPNIDSATVALSSLRQTLECKGALCVVSSLKLCKTMYDKAEAEAFFQEHDVVTPSGDKYPRIAKPRFGASSRGQFIFADEAEFCFWRKHHEVKDYVIQPFIRGTEYSVDAYVNHEGQVQGAVSRVRMVISGGEVMVTRTEHNSKVLEQVDNLLRIPGYFGPVTIQVIDDGQRAYVIECNPRFGSGSTCSIEAGLDSPRWILREFLGRPLPRAPLEWRSGLCMTRARKDYFLWLS